MTPPFLPASGESEIIILTGQPVSQVGKLKKKETGGKKGSKRIKKPRGEPGRQYERAYQARKRLDLGLA